MARRRRAIGLGAALALGALVAVVALLVVAAWRDGEARDLHDAASGVALRYPKGWHVQRYGHYCMRSGPGVVVSNVLQRVRRETIPDGCSTAFDLSGLPDRFALVEIGLFASPLGGGRPPEVPHSLDDLQRFPSPGCRRCAQYVGGASNYVVRIVFGPRASRAEKQAVEHMLASLKLERMRRD